MGSPAASPLVRTLVTRTGVLYPNLSPVEGLLREAAATLDALGVEVSASRLRRLVRRYGDTARPGQTFGAWFLGYADPTGNAAVRHVMTGDRNG